MKKVMFTFVATLAFGLFASANTIELNTSNVIKNEVKKTDLAIKNILIENEICEEEVGRASDCVQYARNLTLQVAASQGMDPTRGSDDFDELMTMYHNLYIGCYLD
jgi:hypothetical protein